jgi:hypothetical protein
MAYSETTNPGLLLLAEADNVLIAGRALDAGTPVTLASGTVTLGQTIPRGYKIARRAIAAGEKVLKYGAPIGTATEAIAPGQLVHVHNLASDYTPTHLVAEEGGTP